MKHNLNLDLFIEQAVSDAYGVYTIGPSNLDRVALLAANDLIKNWGPELAAEFYVAIKAEMEKELNGWSST